MRTTGPTRTFAALSLAAAGGAGLAWFTLPSAALSPEDAATCQAIVWVMQRTGYERDEGGSIIPVDHRPDLTARGDAITAALGANAGAYPALDDSAVDAIWAKVEKDAWIGGDLEPIAADCERKLGLRL